MDGRKCLGVAALLLTGLVGCAPSQLLPGKSPATPPVDSITAANPVKDPISRDPVKDLNPKTIVAMGRFHMQMAQDMAPTPGEKERMYGQAEVAFRQALAKDPKFVPAYLGLAELAEKLDKPEKAVAQYDAALKIASNDPGLWYTCGMCLNRCKQWEPAAARLRKAVDIDPTNRQFVSSYAFTLARAGKYDECLEWLGKINTQADAHFALARLLNHTEDYDRCRQELELALQAQPGHPGATQLVQSMTLPVTEPLPGTGSMNAN